jgi:hypothetical protein
MVTTFLSDDFINSRELRNNQKHWLEKAFLTPISIRSGDKKLVLINRDQARDVYLINYYAQIVIQFCQERSGENKESKVFPWTKHLQEEQIKQFHKQLLACFNEIIQTKDWFKIDELLDDWKATAEVAGSSILSKELLAEEKPSEYAGL